MPVIFGPPEWMVITDRSPVAAGGIANVSPIFRARLGWRLMIVSVALSICQFRFRSRLLSQAEHPIFRRSAYTESPRILLSGLSWAYRLVHPENPGSQSATLLYHTIPRTVRVRGILIKRLTRKKLATDFVHSGATNWTLAFHCRFAVFHGDFDCFRIFALRAAFDTIHTCHITFTSFQQ